MSVINYYRDMWISRSYTLTPLTKVTVIKNKFKLTNVEQDYLDKINWIVYCNTLLTYPYYNETFKVYTNAISFQLVAVISQKGKPIDFYSRKLTDAQQLYAVTEI